MPGSESPTPSPWRLGGLSLRALVVRVWDQAGADEVLHRAGALSYAFLFSIFPALLFVIAVVRLVHVHHVIRQLMDYAQNVLPGDAAAMVRTTLRHVVTTTGHPSLASLGALAALWFGSTGLASIMTALNAVYGVRDERRWWTRRAVAVLLTLVFSVLLIVALTLLMAGAWIGAALGGTFHLGPGVLAIWNGLTVALAVFFVLIAIALVYRFAPAGHRPWRWITPGSVTATALWLVASFGLRVYVRHVATYDVTYGSIGAVILLLLWLYVTSLALLVGAEVDAEIAHAQAREAAAAPAPGARRVA